MAQLSITNGTLSTANYDVTSFGTLQWATFATADDGVGDFNVVNYKSGGPIFSPFSVTPADPDFVYFRGDDRTKSWSGGANTPSSGSDNFGVRAEQYIGTGATGKFTIAVEADTTARTMRVYMASNDITTTITASLSDSSAGPAIDNTTFSGSDAERHGYVDITYQAGSAGQTLTVVVEVTVPKVTDDYGMVALQSLAWQLAAGDALIGQVWT